MELDKQIKRLLSQRGITIAKLGRDTGVSPKTIYQWVNGQKPGNIEHVKKVANYFGISLDALVFGELNSKELTEVFPEINAGVYEVILRKIKSE